jgi:hypothetical protein
MLNAKIKLKNLRTGQESLLLVVKMNLKGLLVKATHAIDPGTPLLLSLWLGEGDPIEVRGEVHKITERAQGNPGIVVRFVHPSPEHLERILAYLKKYAPELGMPKPVRPPPPSEERTTLAELNSISRLALSSPDRKTDSVLSTVDEESLSADHPGLAEETRTFDILPLKPVGRRRKARSPLRSGMKLAALGTVLLLLAVFLVLPALRYLDRRFGSIPTEPEKIGTPAKLPGTSPLPTATPVEEEEEDEPAPPTPTPTPKPKAKKKPEEKPTPVPVGVLESFAVEDVGGFLKVTVRGSGDFTRYAASRALSPKRLMLDFPRIRKTSAVEPFSVGRNPLLRIRTQSREEGIRVIFDLYPVEFPRYQIKSRAGSADIFFQR